MLITNLINITPVIAQASHEISAFIKEQSTIDEDAPQDAALVKSPQFAPNFPTASNFEGFVAKNSLTQADASLNGIPRDTTFSGVEENGIAQVTSVSLEF